MSTPREWTSTGITNLFRLSNVASKQTLFNAEEREEIPKAKRINRGSTQVRMWTADQLPDIGKKIGFLKKPQTQQIICIYTSKGGVLKTTFSYNLARILALNGINVLIVGLDTQLSITEAISPILQIESLQECKEHLGLYHFLKGKSIKETIYPTDLRTLSYVPETPELSIMEKEMRSANRKEYVILDKVLPLLTDFDVVIFDNSPSWSSLIENALVASGHIISPIGCEINSYRALKQHMQYTTEFASNMKLCWKNFFLAPTLLDKTTLSQQIYGTYLNEHPKNLLPFPIRRSVKGHEASLLGVSVIEHESTSTLAQDYYDLVKNLWDKINVT